MNASRTTGPHEVGSFSEALKIAREHNQITLFRIDGKGPIYRMTLDGEIEAERKPGVWQTIY